MTVFARDLHSQATFSTHVDGSADFEIEVPGPAEYVVFAWTDPGIYTEESLGGMYSCMGMFVGQMNYLGKARVHLTCDDQESHIPLAVAVDREQTVDGTYVCDFYAQDYVPRP